MLKVNEIFHSIQGESTHAGRPCVFVRLTACNLRCTYCDTEYAFHEGEPMALEEIVAEVARHGCELVELTGGEPLLQDEAIPLMERLLAEGYEVLLETSGSVSTAEVPREVRVILDLKTPASGEVDRNLWSNLEHLGPGDEVKFVVCNRSDYDWVCTVLARHRLTERVPVLLSPAWGELEPSTLAGWILEDRLPVRLQVQMHKIVWSPQARGV